MKTTVIHHSADFDGLFCREIARKFLPDAELIGWDFGDKPLQIPSGPIYVMDLPLDKVFGFDYAKVGNERGPQHPHGLVWIDHHKTSIDTHPKDIHGYRIDGVAACRLAWQWFTNSGYTIKNTFGEPEDAHDLPSKEMFVNRQVSEPLAVRLAGEYDIWDKRDPNAELFQHGLRSEELTPGTWSDMLSPLSGEVAGRLLAQGRGIQFARAQEYAEVITQQGFDLQWEGLTFLACNSHELDIRSHLFEAGLQPHHDAMLGFTYNGKSDDWRISLYGRPEKPDIDLSEIAKRHGGGGHKHACGFRCRLIPFGTRHILTH